MQQTMDEITDNLATIEEKVDDVLRAQEERRVVGHDRSGSRDRGGHDHPGAGGPGFRDHVVEGAGDAGDDRDDPGVRLASTRRTRGEEERKPKVGDLAEAVREAQSRAQEWLAVLARCFQMQDAIAVLELDRVLDAAPEELDRHRLGIRIARQNRLDLIARSTERLVTRMNAAAGAANAKVLLHPTKSPAVVQLSNHVVTGIHDFHVRLGIESGRRPSETRRWAIAAAEGRDKALEAGVKGFGAARSLGNETLDRASWVMGKLSSGIAERARRRRGGRGEREEEG